MLAEKKVWRLKDLNPSELKIMEELRGGPKTVKEMQVIFGTSYNAVKRPLDALINKDLVEQDLDSSAFNQSKSWRIKRTPTDGIEIEINSNGELVSVSFNHYLKLYANQTSRGELPRVGREYPQHPMAIALLAIYAAVELESPGTVSELKLLEVRSPLSRYREALKEEYARVSQILDNEAFWDPKSLVNGAAKKTDLPLTPEELKSYARTIAARFNPGVSSIASEEETDNDE